MKKIFSVIFLAALAGCSSFKNAKKTDDSFVIASYNVRCPCDKGDNQWRLRIPRMANVIKKYGFDIFGVQEAVKHVADVLQAELPHYRRIGCGRAPMCNGESNYIFYDGNRFECIDYGTFWLSGTPLVSGSRYEGAGCPRICTWGRFKDLRTGKTFTYYNTHLDHISSRARLDGAKVLAANGLRASLDRGETVFLTGDMNETLAPRKEDSPESLKKYAPDELKALAEKNPIAFFSTLLNDTYAVSETPHAGTHETYTGYKDPPRVRIDYVYATGNVKVLSHVTVNDRIDGKFPSDHDPVAATVEIR